MEGDADVDTRPMEAARRRERAIESSTACTVLCVRQTANGKLPGNTGEPGLALCDGLEGGMLKRGIYTYTCIIYGERDTYNYV